MLKHTGVKKVVTLDSLGGSPARVNIKKGTLFIGKDTFKKLPPKHQKAVLLHEIGHIATRSIDEVKADTWALNNAHRVGLDPKYIVFALTSWLDKNDPKHRNRVLNLYKLYKMNYAADINEADFWGKKARARRAKRRDEKHERKLEKLEAKRALAAAGGGATNAVKGIFSGLGNAIGGVLGTGGGGMATEAGYYTDYSEDTPTEANNTWIYVVIGVVVVGIILLAFRKKIF